MLSQEKFNTLVEEVKGKLQVHRQEVFCRCKVILSGAIIESDRREDALETLFQECFAKVKSDAWHIINCAFSVNIENDNPGWLMARGMKEYHESVSRLMGRVLTVAEAMVEPARIKALKSLLTQAVWRHYEPTFEEVFKDKI